MQRLLGLPSCCAVGARRLRKRHAEPAPVSTRARRSLSTTGGAARAGTCRRSRAAAACWPRSGPRSRRASQGRGRPLPCQGLSVSHPSPTRTCRSRVRPGLRRAPRRLAVARAPRPAPSRRTCRSCACAASRRSRRLRPHPPRRPRPRSAACSGRRRRRAGVMVAAPARTRAGAPHRARLRAAQALAPRQTAAAARMSGNGAAGAARRRQRRRRRRPRAAAGGAGAAAGACGSISLRRTSGGKRGARRAPVPQQVRQASLGGCQFPRPS